MYNSKGISEGVKALLAAVRGGYRRRGYIARNRGPNRAERRKQIAIMSRRAGKARSVRERLKQGHISGLKTIPIPEEE